jgi:hypothetical protein
MTAMSKSFSLADLLWLALFMALLAGIGWMMFRVRESVVESSSAASQQDWDAWRESVAEGQSKSSPVLRRVPKSAEPPALVLLRDHFAVCLTIALVLSSVVFGTFVLFARGVLNSPAIPPRQDSQYGGTGPH